jgi:hypothetical protein
MWNMTYGDKANILQIGIGKMKTCEKLQYGIKNEHCTKMLVKYKTFPSEGRLQWPNIIL